MSDSPAASDDLLQALRQRADGEGFIELPDFLSLALYHPTAGYYQTERRRVGRSAQSDFYTSVTLREAFAEIVAEAAVDLLLAAGIAPRDATCFELGAEPSQQLFDETNSPFARCRPIGVNDTIALEGPAVVFSNELFDAQPFRQIRFDGHAWREYGLRFDGDALRWTPRPEVSQEAAAYLDQLPPRSLPGYTIDLPTGSRALAREILRQPWRGAFIAFDYGKTWASLFQETPQGTARAYRQHQQGNDILAAPGEHDITHHICWDHLETELADAGFSKIALQSQESFIAHRAPKFLQTAFDPSRSALDPIRTKLKQLMHPALMGQKFQALSAIRP